MSLLSNLWGGVKSVASTVGNALSTGAKNLYNEVAGTAKTVAGTAINTVGQILNNNKLANTGTALNTTGTTQSGRTDDLKPTGTPTPTFDAPTYAALPFNNSYWTAGTNVRPSTSTASKSSSSKSTYDPNWKPTTDSYGRTSNKNVGVAYEDAYGNTIVPKVAFSGVSGSGSSFNFTPPTATLAAQGMAGRSNFTGTLSATGGASASVNSFESDEDTKKKKSAIQDIQSKGFLSSFNNGAPVFMPQVLPTMPQFTAGPVSNQMDAGALSDTRTANIENTSSTGLQSDNDVGDLNTRLAYDYDAKLKENIQNSPIPENPVIDTPEQLAFMEQSGDPFGVRQAMDDFKAEQTNLGELQKQRIDVMKQIQALNDTYSPIIDEIKNNPNLPKGLAARRLEEINRSQKNVLQGFINQVELLNQSIDDQNEMVNRAFNIVGMSQSQADKAQDNARQTLSLMINSGAIGGFTDKDIQTYSQATGIPTSSLAAMRTAANQPDLQTSIVGTESTGYFAVSIDKKTGKTVSKTQIVGAPQSSGTSAMVSDVTGKPLTDAERTARGFANRAANASAVIDSIGFQFVGTGSYIGAKLPNILKSEDRQKFEQAQRDFINAVLRRESGAVISEEEFANARQQYFPQPGDQMGTILQKANNRKATISNLQLSGGMQPQSGTSGQTSSGLKYTITQN